MITTTSSALLLVTVAFSAASSFAAPIRIPVGARDVAPPEVEQLSRRIPQVVSADNLPGVARSEDKLSEAVGRRFPRRVYYEYYARNAAPADPQPRHHEVERAPEPPSSEPEARSPAEMDADALEARNKRRESRKRTNSGGKAARALVNAPGVKVRSPGSKYPIDARAAKIESHHVPRAAEPVAKPVARDAKPEEVARDTTYLFGDIVTNSHYHQHDDLHIHEEGTTIIVEVTPSDGSDGTVPADGGKPSQSGSPSGSFVPGSSNTASGTGTTPTATGTGSAVTGTASSTTGAPGAAATVTVTVTTTVTATGSATASSATATSSSPASSTATPGGKGKGLGKGGQKSGPLGSSTVSDPSGATPTVTTGTSPTDTTVTGTIPVKREPGHPWMKMMRRETPVARRREAPEARSGTRRGSIIWGR